MAKNDGLDISLEVNSREVKRVSKAFNPYLKVPQVLFGGKLLQDLILSRTKARLDRKGSSRVAQKDPRYKPWRPLAASTIRTGGDQNRKLNRTGTLQDSITIINDTLGSALYTNTGAGFRVGVKESSPAGEYARIQNQGGWAGRGGSVYIPARRYLGIGRPDKLAVTKLIKDVMKKEGI